VRMLVLHQWISRWTSYISEATIVQSEAYSLPHIYHTDKRKLMPLERGFAVKKLISFTISSGSLRSCTFVTDTRNGAGDTARYSVSLQ
jgi:hypothetical protein